MIAWWTSFSALALLWIVIAWRSNPRRALGITTLVSCLVPSWCSMELFGEPLDVRLAALLFGLLAYCFHKQATFPVRLGVLDACMLALIAVHGASDSWNSGWTWTIPLRIYGEWCACYIAGRLCLQDLREARYLAPVGAVVALLFAGLGWLESLSHEHPWEWVYGERPYMRISRDAERWGLLRAWGPTIHGIYFGLLQLTFLPWCIYLVVRFRKSIHGLWIWLMPLIVISGIVTTGSRAPILAFFITILGTLFLSIPKSRWILVALAILFAVVGIFNRNELSMWIHRWSGEQTTLVDPSHKIVLDGDRVAMTGTLNRLHLIRYYRKAVKEGGWLGFGTARTSDFPVQVPVGEQDQSARNEIWICDNAFLLITLRFGWLGGFFFAMAFVLAVIAWILRSRMRHQTSHELAGTKIKDANRWNSDRLTSRVEESWLCTSSAAMVFSCAVALITVWLSFDLSFMLLWWLGASSVHRKDSL